MDGRTGTRSRMAVIAAGVAVVVAILVWNTRGAGRTVELPPAGEVAASFVEDHPVFVVHRENGTVLVLDAVSPHAPPIPKVLAWCRTSGGFEDLWHGSRFGWDGRWLGGPAPTGLARYEIVSERAGRIEVGARRPPPPRPASAGTGEPVPGTYVLGPGCSDRVAVDTGAADPGVLEDLVIHEPPPEGAGELRYPTPDWILGGDDAAPADS